MTEATHLLNAIHQGDAHAAEELLPLVYDELRRLAAVNDVHYHVPSRRLLQDVLTAIRHGCAVAEANEEQERRTMPGFKVAHASIRRELEQARKREEELAEQERQLTV